MTKIPKQDAVEIRQKAQKKLLLDQLKQMPIIEIAVKKAGVSRASFYRWCGEDKRFKEEADMAIREGEAMITDMSEGQLISLIRDRNFSAIHLWLRSHNPKYSSKLEFYGNLTLEEEKLTPEQEALIARALKLAGITNNNQLNNHEQQ